MTLIILASFVRLQVALSGLFYNVTNSFKVQRIIEI